MVAIQQLLAFEFRHPALGRLTGTSNPSEVVQFQGVPYASIPARFRQSILQSKLTHQPFDATKAGPQCPQPNRPYPEYWTGESFYDGNALPTPLSDELRCLNLSITLPKSAFDHNQALPVLVFIHGGANTSGSYSIEVGGRQVYSPVDLVRASVKRGKPIVVISINYRTGPFGFLASSELFSLNEQHNEPRGNYALHDQVRALEWISRFSAGFGGDPNNVTIYGTSSGAACCQCLCNYPATRKLFQRAILCSGSFLVLAHLSLGQHQKLFDNYAGGLGLNASGPDLVSHLQSRPATDLIGALGTPGGPGSIFLPVTDGSMIDEHAPDNVLPVDTRDLMIGACAFEDEIVPLLYPFLADPNGRSNSEDIETAKQILQNSGLLKGVVEPLTPALMRLYSLESSSNDRSAFLARLTTLIADVLFVAPALHIARERAKHPGLKTYFFHFAATNPYDRVTQSYGMANHGVMDLVLFNPAPEYVPDSHRASWDEAVETTQKKWIDFCYGEQPWKALEGRDDGPIYVFGDGVGRSGEMRGVRDAVGVEVALRWEGLVGSVLR